MRKLGDRYFFKLKLRLKTLISMTVLFWSAFSLAFTDPKVGGTVLVGENLKGKVPDAKGVLFVYARKPGVVGGPPLAVFRFENPRFPQAFVITAKNLIIKEQPFVGPVEVTALYVPSGDPMIKKGGFRGQDEKQKVVELGVKNLNIKLTEAL